MLADLARVPAVAPLLAAYLAVLLARALVPALVLAYNARLLAIVQTAVDARTVDPHALAHVSTVLVLASAATRLLAHLKDRIAGPLHLRIKNYYAVHIFHAIARLDVPTFDDPAVTRQLERAFPPHSSNIAFRALSASFSLFSHLLQLLSQLSVLLTVLSDNPDAPLLAILCCSTAYFQFSRDSQSLQSVWLATTTNSDFIKSEGLKRAVADPIHRKEIVAGAIAPFLLAQYRLAVSRISDHSSSFYEAYEVHQRNRHSFFAIFFEEVLRALPQVVFTLRAVRQPTSIPLSVASLHLITSTTQSFTYAAFSLVQGASTIVSHLTAVRQLYQVAHIPNRVKVHHNDSNDTTIDETLVGTPFPENTQTTIAYGISVEFCNVSFSYPGSDAYALRNVNFKLERGQLCVIVGNNGSGKSTILKLITRLYDPTEGTILIDGIDIKTLRLADLRRAISVLFQDYTHFPLSIHDNIALGDPAHADDRAKVEHAAQLGGASAFIERLPDTYDTYLERPVQDYYSALPERTDDDTSDDHPVDFAALRTAAGITQAQVDGVSGGVGNRGLSGGQMQRIALSRTFMRSVVSDESVGLLLFDEPSASLDPTAEHDLFERLRTLRGNKTMVFSSHRFGSLTRHADCILYMDDSHIVEEGTHDELIARGGEYARIWMLQARAFL
ncbi:P-loop containing nucleoside triphosphate hydrolase protein [Pholiota conissans]|uniref:P-loop containing nucleoside triphosphate hydrolase protein n=1 Tax=Pholiota conissans TaxID=109636 RepID=A0A9P5YZX0_9AGAR|nr:P-loop containing nucleoside triphosphate hydrolase protein [Pholiota conissans]